MTSVNVARILRSSIRNNSLGLWLSNNRLTPFIHVNIVPVYSVLNQRYRRSSALIMNAAVLSRDDNITLTFIIHLYCACLLCRINNAFLAHGATYLTPKR